MTHDCWEGLCGRTDCKECSPCLCGESEDTCVCADIGTCQGCGSYGPLGRFCIRDGEECGEWL